MKRNILFDAKGIRFYQTSWGSGTDSLQPAWQTPDLPRLSFPQIPLYYKTRERSDLVAPGDAIVWGIESEHQVVSPLQNPGCSFWISIDPAVFIGLTGHSTDSKINTSLNRKILRPGTRVLLVTKAIAHHISNRPVESIEIESLLYEIVKRVCHNQSHVSHCAPDSKRHQEAIVHSMTLLSSGDSELTLAKIGKEIHLSPHYFCRVFKKCTGMTVHRFRSKSRLLNAADRVLTNCGALANIAVECGFSDQAHMTRCFKHAFGVPPAKLAHALAKIEQLRTFIQDRHPQRF